MTSRVKDGKTKKMAGTEDWLYNDDLDVQLSAEVSEYHRFVGEKVRIEILLKFLRPCRKAVALGAPTIQGVVIPYIYCCSHGIKKWSRGQAVFLVSVKRSKTSFKLS